MNVKGRVWRFGDDVNTDVIFPGKYTYTVTEPADMAKHAMEDADPEFAKGVQQGDIIVAGKNFGCGSSREQAVTAPKYAGVGAIIAKSFARIYFRNCINQGLPILSLPEVDELKPGDEVEVVLEEGLVRDLTTGKDYRAKPLPPFIMDIITAGGLIPSLKKKLGTE